MRTTEAAARKNALIEEILFLAATKPFYEQSKKENMSFRTK